MKRMKIVTVVTAQVTEEWVIDVPDDIEEVFDNIYQGVDHPQWAEVLSDFDAYHAEFVTVENTNIDNEQDREVILVDEIEMPEQPQLRVI